MTALLALALVLAAPGQKTLTLKDLNRVFPHGDSVHVIRMASFTTERLGRGKQHFVSYLERGRLRGLLYNDDDRVVGRFEDEELLANVQSARVVDVDGDGRKDVLVIFTYQQPAHGTEALAAQVLLQRSRGRFLTAPAWAENVKRRLAKLDPSEFHSLQPEDVVRLFRDTRRQ